MIRRSLARSVARRRATAVLALGELLTPVLDEIAAAYDADPVAVGRLLRMHAAAVCGLELAAMDPTASHVELAVRRSEVEGTGAALLTFAPSARRLAVPLSREACMHAADLLTARAAEIHINAPGETA